MATGGGDGGDNDDPTRGDPNDYNADIINEDNDDPTTGDPCDYNADIICGDDEWKSCVANTGNPAKFTILNDSLIFTAFSGCKNLVSTELFEIDSAGDVKEVYEIASYDLDDQDSIFASYTGNFRSIVTINNVAYFPWKTNLYEYDGVNPVQMIDEGISSDILMAYNDKLYYTVYDPNSGPPGPGLDFNHLLYSYDGNSPVFVEEISGYLTKYTVYNGRLYLFTEEGIWCYDGNTDVLSFLYDMKNDLIWYPSLVIFQDKLYFNADDGDHGNQLWVIDTENNVSMVTSLSKINTYLDSFAGPMAVFQGRLLCTVYESANILRLWAYDGEDINPVPVNDPYTYVKGRIIFNDHFYFLGPESSGMEIDLAVLWSYDGSNAPTRISTSEYLRDIFPFSGKLLLQTEDRLLIYDGNSSPQVFAQLGDTVLDAVDTIIAFNNNYYATGDSQNYGFELWEIGTAGEITLVKDFYPGITCSCEND